MSKREKGITLEIPTCADEKEIGEGQRGGERGHEGVEAIRQNTLCLMVSPAIRELLETWGSFSKK